MAEIQDRRREYYIPDNFIEEGRIFQGRIRIRNLIEGIILAAVFAVPALFIISVSPRMELQGKITLIIFMCAPPAVLGITGFNGDRLFAAARSAMQWKKRKYTMLYNTTPRLLKVDIVSAHFSEDRKVDRVLDRYEDSRQRRIEEQANLSMVEGRDFTFEEDETLGKYSGNPEEGRHRTKDTGKGGKRPDAAGKNGAAGIATEINVDDVIEERMELF